MARRTPSRKKMIEDEMRNRLEKAKTSDIKIDWDQLQPENA